MSVRLYQHWYLHHNQTDQYKIRLFDAKQIKVIFVDNSHYPSGASKQVADGSPSNYNFRYLIRAVSKEILKLLHFTGQMSTFDSSHKVANLLNNRWLLPTVSFSSCSI